MFKKSERRNRRGFTLAEVLTVVAIIGILLAVAIPNVISYYRSLKLTELDDSAKTIFMAAQSRLTAMTAAGQDLYKEFGNPLDVPTSVGSTVKVTPVSDKSKLDTLVLGGSIESQLHDNNYVVEIDPKTGAVYAVWYWEKDGKFNYADAYTGGMPDRDWRLDKMAGYYGGDKIDRLAVGQMPIPELTLINAEELRLEIRIPKIASGIDVDNFDHTKIRVDVLVNNKLIIKNAYLHDMVNPDNRNDYVGKVVLDTLTPPASPAYTPTIDDPTSGWTNGWTVRNQFKDWKFYDDATDTIPTGVLKNVAIPGSDITVEVRVHYEGDAALATGTGRLLSQSATVHTNSLFAGLDDDGSNVYAQIAYGRHLQNLDAATSNVGNSSSIASKVSQIRDINFASTNPNPSTKPEDDIKYWASTYSDDSTYSGGKLFKPITNPYFNSYDGLGHEIRNLDVVTTDAAGLFLTNVTGFEYNNLTLVNPRVVSTGTSGSIRVGALVGQAAGSIYVTDCGVYDDYDAAKDPEGVKTLLESTLYSMTESTVASEFEKKPYIGAMVNGTAGGLVGWAPGGEITRSFASAVICGSKNAGGLVGETRGQHVKIKRSYSAGFVFGTGNCAGLIGHVDDAYRTVMIENSYAAGEIVDAGAGFKGAGLFVREPLVSGSNVVTSCYAAVKYAKAGGGSITDTVYGTFNGDTTGSNYYVKQTGVTYDATSGNGVSMSALKDMIGDAPFNGTDWYDPGTGTNVNPQGLTNPYNLLDDGLADPYPYPMLASSITAVGGEKLPMPHYGDWLENSYATSFYWEREGVDTAGNPKYNFYLVLSDGTTQYIADNLCTEYHLNPATRTDVEAWGYGLIGIDADAVTDAGLDASIDSTATNKSDIINGLTELLDNTITPDPWKGATPVEPLEDIKALLDDTNVILLKGAEKDDFHAIKTKVGYIEMNLGFAAAIHVTASTTAPTTATTDMGTSDAFPYQIRTVQQLDNIGGDADTTKHRFKQTHDINGTGFADYSGVGTFSGSYTGGFYRILDLNINNGGLFQRLVNASVEGVILYSPTGNATVTQNTNNSAGGIAYTTGSGITSTIKNCVVAGYTITGSTAQSAGGLIGNHYSDTLVIENCEAWNKLNGGYVGGLVGTANDSAILNIKNSYAGGEIVSAGHKAGGLVGSAGTNSRSTITYKGDVYSYVEMDETGVTASEIHGIGLGTVESGGTAQYWSGGLNGKSATDATGVTAVPLADLKAPAGSEAQQTYKPGADMTEGLTNTHDTENYPFTPVAKGPRTNTSTDTDTVLVHYGSWPPDEPAAQSFGYYDDGGGSVGFYGYIVDPATSAQTFANSLTAGTPGSGNCATVDGYCIPVEQVGGASTAPAAPTVDGITCTVDSTPVATDVTVDTSGKTYDLYKINGLEGVGATNYYNKITVGSTEYWFNPFFACEVIPTSTAGTKPTTPQAKTGAAGQGTSDDYNGQVVIRAARQLVWLGELTKDIKTDSGDPTNTSVPYFTCKYHQLWDIDYSTYTGYESTFAGRTNDAGTLQLPINIVKTGSSSIGAYDGEHFLVKNLHISTNNQKVGFMGIAKGITVSNVRLVDTIINSTNTDRNESCVGGLIGEIMGADTTVSDCGIYLDSGDYGTCTVSASAGNTGGLIGNAGNNATISSCFAAVKVSGQNTVGGLAGYSKPDTTFENCYSGGHTVSGAYNASDANVTSSSGNAGGLIGQLGNTNTFKGICYSTCSVSGNNVGQLIGKTGTSSAPTTTGATLYATGTTSGSYDSDVKRWEDANLTDYTANLADILAVTNNKTGVDAQNTKYDSGIGNTYPYLTASGAEHHGDWPELQEAVFYWEQEGTGTDIATKQSGAYNGAGYHFYAKGYLNNQEVTLDTLCTEHHTVEETLNTNTISYTNWGYGLYGKTVAQAPTIPADVQQTTNTYAVAGFKKLLSLDSTGVSVNLLKGRPSIGSSPSSTSTSVTHNYKFNVNFGAAIEVDTSGTSTMGTSGNPYKIRNVKQLDNIPGSASYEYEQTHDLDGSSTPSYNGPSAFAGTYDGRSYRILEISDIGGSGIMTNYALFVSLSNGATLRNIILYSPSGKGAFSAESASSWGAAPVVGGLVGSCENTGTGTISITNCVVAGYNLSFPDGGVGALVGRVKAGVTLNIDRCEAVNTITASTAQGVGGLVGNVEGTVNITNSYAGGKIILSTAGGTSNLSDAGGLVGKIGTTGSCTYTNVYAYMDMTDTGLNITGSVYGIGPGGTSGTYDNCHYWSGGLNGQPAADNGQSGITEETNVADLADCMSGAKDIGGNLIFSTSTDTVASYPTTSTGAPTGNYPYPAVVREVDEDGNPTNVFVHYGDWPT